MQQLKQHGFTRVEGCLQRFPVSKSAWWLGVSEGRYPTAIKLSPRTTAWKNSDLDELEELLAAGKDWRDHIESKAVEI